MRLFVPFTCTPDRPRRWSSRTAACAASTTSSAFGTTLVDDSHQDVVLSVVVRPINRGRRLHPSFYHPTPTHHSQLTRLRLDNNGITTMANLEELVHLSWLDLSFNRIERISVR